MLNRGRDLDALLRHDWQRVRDSARCGDNDETSVRADDVDAMLEH